MSSQPKSNMTAKEYLAIERDVQNRHEFYRGEMFAMGGASRAHNQIALNLARLLGNEFADRKCTVYVSDMRVLVSDSGLYTYPDLVITCESPEFEDEHVDTLLNPQVVIEILSNSTEVYDRGKKFEHYRQISSLKDYILVSQDHAQIDHFNFSAQGRWVLTDASGLQASLAIETIDCQLVLAEVYAKVEFPPPEPIPGTEEAPIGPR